MSGTLESSVQTGGLNTCLQAPRHRNRIFGNILVLSINSAEQLQGPLPLSAGVTECGLALLQNQLGAKEQLQRPTTAKTLLFVKSSMTLP